VGRRDACGVQPGVRADRRAGHRVALGRCELRVGKIILCTQPSLVMFISGERASPFLPLWHVPCRLPAMRRQQHGETRRAKA
jgi:hypothetical protein